MIKALTHNAQGKPIIFLGLSDLNWERLRANKPILVRLRDLADSLPDLDVVLLGGATEEEIVEDIRSLGPIRPVGDG